VPPVVVELAWNAATLDELAGHGLSLDDAQTTLALRPKFFPNNGNRERRGFRRRWMMIGPNGNGQLLTFIIEDPDDERIAHLVTGWHSNAV
jgi:uncharacterized DUF497 family protein